jgi:ATP synthase protein I
MNEEEKNNEKKKMLKQMSIFITIPFVMAVPPIIGWLLGGWLDKFFDTEPFFTYSMIIFGIIAGFREFYRILKKYGDGV